MNDNVMVRGNVNAVSATEESKKIAEVQGKMILARRFPRDVQLCEQMIATECRNIELAEKAIYEFPRGDSVVRGASIRLVECVARHWGNITSGVEELSSDAGGATVRAYCWDLETNFSDEKIFDVAYVRVTKNGSYPLKDPRDRYEKMANEGARRKRACIQAVIPQFVIDKAMSICQETLEISMQEEASEETLKKMLAAFQALAEWISEDDLSAACGKEFGKLGARDIVKLRNLYNAIKDGFVKPEAAFKKDVAEMPVTEKEQGDLDRLNGMIGKAEQDGTDS